MLIEMNRAHPEKRMGRERRAAYRSREKQQIRKRRRKTYRRKVKPALQHPRDRVMWTVAIFLLLGLDRAGCIFCANRAHVFFFPQRRYGFPCRIGSRGTGFTIYIIGNESDKEIKRKDRQEIASHADASR